MVPEQSSVPAHLPPGWHRRSNYTPWRDVVCVSGRRPVPDEISVGESEVHEGVEVDGIQTTHVGIIDLCAPDDAEACRLAWDIYRGLLATGGGQQ
jgi:protein-tyrosine phosphatase